MSEDTLPEEIDSEERFNELLGHLLVEAHEHGVPVAGGWSCRNHSEAVPDWDVTVTELEKRGGD